ncbi:MAG: hypothetical protein IJF07_09315 [Lachnospiraceae bacterium]|nr:hypothetical protein [Lachnospiraceae bacterium]
MKLKGVKILQTLAIIMQLLVVLIIVAMTMAQSTIKQMYISDTDVAEYWSIPIEELLRAIPLLLIYIIGMAVMSHIDASAAKTKAITFAVLACIWQVISRYSSLITVLIAKKQGEIALISYSTLSGAIAQLTIPFTWVAFALFCVACGGYPGALKEEGLVNV